MLAAGNGAMVKRLHLGRAAEAGILAARLAESRFEGPDTILEGGYGFLETYCAESDPALLVAGLGERFETGKLCIKRYPCHVTAHTPLVAVEALRREHGFDGDDVASVIVRASAKVVSHHADREPADAMAAQYSVPYCVAVALRDDPMDPDAFGARGLGDAGIRALCRAVRCEALAEPRDAWASEVEIRLKDGRLRSRRVTKVKATPDDPPTKADVYEKFSLLTRHCPRAPMDELFTRLQSLEKEPDLAWISV